MGAVPGSEFQISVKNIFKGSRVREKFSSSKECGYAIFREECGYKIGLRPQSHLTLGYSKFLNLDIEVYIMTVGILYQI